MGADGDDRRVSPTSFRAVLRLRAFLVLYVAEAQSITGDQLARVALSVLVYDDTGSAVATATVYAATFLPAILGGFALGHLGDRYPRRWVMVGCDLSRAVCFAVMAVPAVPFAAMVAVLVIAVFLGPAFTAAEVSYLADRLDGEQFRTASALRLMTSQAAQVGGFALGGVLVAVVHPRGALAVDAATFFVSAVLVAVLLPDIRSSSHRDELPEAAARGGLHAAAFTGLWADPRLRTLVALSAVVGFFVVPEALAVPFGDSVRASTAQIGLLLASGAFGGAVGAVLLVRAVAPERRGAVAKWMAVGCGLPLVVSALAPHWSVAMVCWFASGILAAYIIELMAILVHAIPETRRAQLVGVAGALLLSAQGVGFVVFGAMTAVMSPAHAIGLAGLIGTIVALLLILGPLRRAPEYRAAHRADGRYELSFGAQRQPLALSRAPSDYVNDS